MASPRPLLYEIKSKHRMYALLYGEIERTRYTP